MQSPQGPSILEQRKRKKKEKRVWRGFIVLKQLSRVWTLSRNSSRHHTAAEFLFFIRWCVIPEKWRGLF
ncbi:Uncharacterized protein APZ42_023519 [Daphnia magna]|uniref:Uncharacterized protein n=1 Tax=Daphnia magna TaxID=35525 RepID=A0A164UW41_9CRUS|nr:Uncharacterized protein APZ42_023519 [Daphnia magna]